MTNEEEIAELNGTIETIRLSSEVVREVVELIGEGKDPALYSRVMLSLVCRPLDGVAEQLGRVAASIEANERAFWLSEDRVTGLSKEVMHLRERVNAMSADYGDSLDTMQRIELLMCGYSEGES